MPNVLITDGFSESATAILKDAKEIELTLNKSTPREELLAQIATYEALIVRSATQVDQEVIDKASNLKLIVRAGEGVDNIDLKAASQRGIPVMNTPGANNNAVVELTLGFLLSLSRHIASADHSMKAAKWEKALFKGQEIEGRTLAVIGLGKIGRIVATKAHALGMKITVYDPFVKTSPHPEFRLTDSLTGAVEDADYVTVHVPYSKNTHHLINEAVFKAMKPGAYFLDVARGGILDEKALLNALKSGKLKGAALDVWSEEPPTAENQTLQALRNHPALIATPHIGASTEEAQDKVGTIAAHQLIGFFRDGIKENVVNP